MGKHRTRALFHYIVTLIISKVIKRVANSHTLIGVAVQTYFTTGWKRVKFLVLKILEYLFSTKMQEGFLFDENNSTQATTAATTVSTNHHCPRVIIQVVVSILSFLASLLVSISVAAGGKDNTKNTENTNTESSRLLPFLGLLLKNPYRRIIFGLCLADMFLSYSLAIGKRHQSIAAVLCYNFLLTCFYPSSHLQYILL